MKKILKLTLLVIVMALFSTSAMAQKTNQKAVIKTVLHCDHCKQCETCGLKFKMELLKLKGVKMYELNDEAMTLTVYYNAKKTNLQTIREGISKLGYDADDVKADPDAYERLDNCCKV